MLMIRLQRVGRRNDPSFRVVITDSRNSTKSGKFIEIVGNHDTRHKDKIRLVEDRRAGRRRAAPPKKIFQHGSGHGRSETVKGFISKNDKAPRLNQGALFLYPSILF